MKCKKILLKICILCFMPLLALLITISNSYAYYLNSDNNIISDNLYSFGSSFSNTITDTRSYLDLRISFNNQTNVVVSQAYTTDGYKSVTFTTPNVVNNIMIKHNGSSADITILETNNDNWLSPNTTYTFSFDLLSNDPTTRGGLYLNNIMLNIGSSALSYEPYGIWYNEESYETQKYLASLSNITDTFNMAIIEVIDSNNNDAPSEVMYLNNTSSVLNFSLFPSTIQDYVNNYNLSDDLTIRIILYRPTQVAFYFNSQLNGWSISIDSENQYQSNYTLPLTPDNYQAFGTLTDYSFTISPNFVYRVIDIEGFRQAHTNFSISLSTDNYFYRDGYNDGYNRGLEQGYNNGYNNGKVDSYNEGYNDGVEQDFASSGFKTLITSILSYPINLIRNSLDFDFMGVNIANIVMFLVSLGIVAFVIKEFKD